MTKQTPATAEMEKGRWIRVCFSEIFDSVSGVKRNFWLPTVYACTD